MTKREFPKKINPVRDIVIKKGGSDMTIPLFIVMLIGIWMIFEGVTK